MEFKKKYKIKPKEIRKNGVIIFTDGTNEMMPNQETCLAYGYEFQDGICRAFTPSLVIEKKERSKGVTQVGSNNVSSSRNSQVIGESNKITESNNSLVSGEANVIDRGVNNSVVVGKMGRSTHTNELCIGGGGFNSEAGLLQYSVLQVSGKTTSGSNVDLYINGDNVINKEITLPTNSVILYEIFLSALCTGGTRGTAGEYISYQWIGAVRSDNEGVMTNTITINRTLGSDGRGLGSYSIIVTTPTIFRIRVSGQTDVNTQWHAVVKLHINKTNAVEI